MIENKSLSELLNEFFDLRENMKTCPQVSDEEYDRLKEIEKRLDDFWYTVFNQ